MDGDGAVNPPALFLLASNGTNRVTHVKVAACETCGVLIPDDRRERHHQWHQSLNDHANQPNEEATR